MATKFKISEKRFVASRDLAETESRAGLTTDPDFLLEIFNAIEQSVASDIHPGTLSKSIRRSHVLFH